MRKNFKCKLLSAVLVCFACHVQAQTTNHTTKLPDIFPVSPKAFEFIKYTEVPVGKYTGVPNVNIPIYTIAASGVKVPIEVTYHSNGFRVNEEAGWTGLGWTLNAGGSIVQVVNGFDDFGFYRYRDNELAGMVNACSVPSTAFSNGSAVDFLIKNQTNQIFFGTNNSNTFFTWDNRLTDGLKDIRPDVFKFNMLGYSGEFVLDWVNETFKCISDKDMKIEAPNYSNNPVQAEIPPGSFKITTPDGNQFLFTLKEQSIMSGIKRYTGESVPLLENLIGSKSSRVYQLTSITTAGGDLISFNYIQTSELENLPNVSLSYTFQEGAQGVSPVPYVNYPVSTTINYSRQSVAYLDYIDFPNGKIIFNSSDDRTDFVGMRKLNSVVLKDKNDQTINTFSFIYDYFIGHTNGNNLDNYLTSQSPTYNTNKISSELTHRLRLLSVQETGKPAYTFEYDPEQLPKKTSLAIDNWGLYNGKLNNVSLMPNIYMTGLKDVNLIGITNNRNSTLTGSRAGVLKKINYPTGGSSAFEYELNSFENFRVPDDDHASVTSVSLIDRNNSGDNMAQIFSSDVPSVLYAGTFNISTYGPMSSSTTGLSAYIRLTVLQKTTANVNLTNSPSTFWPIYYSTPLGQLSTQINDVLVDTRILQFEFNATTQQYETFKLSEDQVIHIDPANIYIVQAYLDNSWGPQTTVGQGANASVYMTYLKNTSHAVSYGAGVRIKNITTKTASSPPMIKSFEYTGGKVMSPVLYLNNSEVNFFNHASSSTVPIYKTEMSSSSFLAPSTNASGKYVGYDEVAELNSVLDQNNNLLNLNGKVVDFYTNEPDKGALNSIITLDPSQFTGTETYLPFVAPRTYLNYIAPLQKSRIQNGLSKINRVYDASQTLLEQSVNTWNYTMPTDHVYGRISTLNMRSNPDPIAGVIHLAYNVGFYPLLATKTLLTSTEKKVFSNGNYVAIQTDNFYDSHDQLSYSLTGNSDGSVLKTTFKYPYDIPAYSSSMAYAMITPVIEKTEELTVSGVTSPISKVRNDYLFTGGLGGVWKPQSAATAAAANPLSTDITYDLYGSFSDPFKNQLLQYHDKGGIYTTIIWGYGGQYPVARITGKTYADAVSQSGINISTINNLLTSESTMKTELNKLRLLSDCLVTTYTYKPLIGTSCETDPNGRNTYYQYDSNNRLTIIRDHDNNIIKKFCYNYNGQVINCNAQ